MVTSTVVYVHDVVTPISTLDNMVMVVTTYSYNIQL